MNEPVITYSDLKCDPSKRQKHGDKAGQKKTATYSELNFQNPPEQQRSERAQQTACSETEGSRNLGWRKKDPSATPLPWQLATLVLGVLCLILLIPTGLLFYQVNDWPWEHRNCTEQQGHRSQQLTTCQPQSTGCPDVPQDLPPHQGEQCPSRWSRREDKSYLFSPEKRTWAQCKSSCISQAAELLVVDNREERDFINHELFQYYEDHNSAVYYHQFWIGLSYNSETRKWVWVNGSQLSSALFDLPDLSHASYESGACVYVQGGAAKPGDCELTQFCMCGKRREAKRLD